MNIVVATDHNYKKSKIWYLPEVKALSICISSIPNKPLFGNRVGRK